MTDGTFPYNQQDWIDYANALADAAEADPSAYPNVNVYRLNGGTATITNDGGDYPSTASQKLHVAVGSGTLYTTQGQNDKTDGAILAPEATVDIDRKISHVHGWVVAEQIIETYWVNTGGDTGLQIGQNPGLRRRLHERHDHHDSRDDRDGNVTDNNVYDDDNDGGADDHNDHHHGRANDNDDHDVGAGDDHDADDGRSQHDDHSARRRIPRGVAAC